MVTFDVIVTHILFKEKHKENRTQKLIIVLLFNTELPFLHVSVLYSCRNGVRKTHIVKYMYRLSLHTGYPLSRLSIFCSADVGHQTFKSTICF